MAPSATHHHRRSRPGPGRQRVVVRRRRLAAVGVVGPNELDIDGARCGIASRMMVEEVAGDRHRRWLGLVVAVAVVAAAAGFGPGLTRSALRATPWPFDLHAVGKACPDDVAWVCGSIRVPLDRAAPGAESISIQFRVLPRRDRFATPMGTIVVVNGGPGFPSTNLHAWAQKAFGSLLGDRDLLLVDNRGTGASGRIDCPDAQKSLTFATVAKCRAIL